MITCPNCFEQGEIVGPQGLSPVIWSPKICPTCRRTGELSGDKAQSAICPECGGWGKISSVVAEFICPEYNGSGILTLSKS